MLEDQRTLQILKGKSSSSNNMKSSKWPVWLVMLVFWCAGSAQGQTQLVVQEGVLVSRSLSGNVNIGLEKVEGKGVTVELCSPDWKKVLTSTKTDDNGYFSLEKFPGKLFQLRFSSPGVNPLQVKVRLSKHAAQDLKHSSEHRHMRSVADTLHIATMPLGSTYDAPCPVSQFTGKDQSRRVRSCPASQTAPSIRAREDSGIRKFSSGSPWSSASASASGTGSFIWNSSIRV